MRASPREEADESSCDSENFLEPTTKILRPAKRF
jgi:hypothetical protein